MRKFRKGTEKGNIFGLLQNMLVLLLIIGVAYFLLNVMNKKSSPGSGSEKTVLEGARENVDRINAQTKAREDQIEKAMKEKSAAPR